MMGTARKPVLANSFCPAGLLIFTKRNLIFFDSKYFFADSQCAHCVVEYSVTRFMIFYNLSTSAHNRLQHEYGRDLTLLQSLHEWIQFEY